MEKHFIKNGGSLIRKKITDFKELSDDFDVIINCSGLEAKELTGDDSLVPVRGQIARVSKNFERSHKK